MQFELYIIFVLTSTFLEVYYALTTFPILIVISFDGFRHDYVEKTSTPNLHYLYENGVRAKWMKNVYATKTFANHFSIATGLYEETHGVVGNYMYDPETNEVFDRKAYKHKQWWNNNFSTPIWIANQMGGEGRHSGCVFWSGIEVPYFDQLPRYIMSYNSKISWMERVDVAMKWLVAKTNPANLVLFYFEEPDKTGHIYGPDSPQVEEQIRRADHIVGYLIHKLKAINVFNRTNMIILSDHGMANLSGIINLDDFVDPKLYDTFGGTPIFNLWPNEGKEDFVYNALKNASLTHNFKVYKREEIPPEYHYTHHPRILRILVEADEGWGLINSKLQNEPNGTGLGDHGYNNSLPSMHPIFIAHGPAFKTKYLSEPFMSLDVYPLMCNILGIPTPQNNGSLANIAHILKENHWPMKFLAYAAVTGCSLLAFLLIGAAFNTATHYKPPTHRRTDDLYFPEEKENLLTSDDENTEFNHFERSDNARKQ